MIAVDPSDESRALEEGKRVEARYGGKKKWFVGSIEKVNETDSGACTFDIKYADGDRERGVAADLVRPLKLFKVGAAVEARYGGKKKWIAGKVTAVQEEAATYDITYADDGEREPGVMHRYVREV